MDNRTNNGIQNTTQKTQRFFTKPTPLPEKFQNPQEKS